MGTAGYMAPEQARGKNVDKRADIFAFGVVLYEMLRGGRLFEGETVSDTLAKVLMQEPDLKTVPVKVQRLLRRCLEKDPKKRLRDIGVVWELVEESLPPAQAEVVRNRLWPAATALFVLTTLLLAFLHFRETPAETPVLRSTLLAPENTTLDFTNGRGLLALSPDGRRIVFGAHTADGNPLGCGRWMRSRHSLWPAPTERFFLSGHQTAASSHSLRMESSRGSMPRAARRSR